MLGNLKKVINHFAFKNIVLWSAVVVCLLLMISLCFNEGLEWDEAFSYYIVHNRNFPEIIQTLFLQEPSHPALYYLMLRVWTWIWGENLIVYKAFSIAASVSAMILGATAVKKYWGYRTALLFIIPAALAPAVLRYNINVRMYAWCLFFVVAAAVTAYSIVQKASLSKWIVLVVFSVAGVAYQYFAAIFYLFIYIYLFVELFVTNRKSIKYLLGCCLADVLLFLPCLPLFIRQFFGNYSGYFEDKEQITSVYAFLEFAFTTNIFFSVIMGIALLLVSIFALVAFRKRFSRESLSFGWLCLIAQPLGFVIMAATMSLFFSHFFIPRHVMQGLLLLWLGIAIVIPKINNAVSGAYLIWVTIICFSSYEIERVQEYGTIPLIAPTQAFISENMEPGDIVLYDYHTMDMIYQYYMPEQEFVFWEDKNIEELKGKRVWFLQLAGEHFLDIEKDKYGIQSTRIGRFGFQGILQFDLWQIEVSGGQ